MVRHRSPLERRIRQLEEQLASGSLDVASRDPDVGIDLSALTLEKLKWLIAPYTEMGAMTETERMKLDREMPLVCEEFMRRVNEKREEKHDR